MGKKNRNPGSRSKQPAVASSSSVTQSATGGAASDSTSADPSVSFSKIMSAYERALDAIKLGSHHKAMKIMKDTCYNREISDQSALIYRFQSIICGKVAKIISDPSKKERHMKNAIEYARKAAEISPSSLVFAHSYAQLLFDAANDRTEYEQVVDKCERALKISNPIYHEMESLKDDSQPELSTAEIQNDLRRLIQKSNERKKAPEDLQTEKKTNEIKNVTEKTREDIKKNIEAKVAIARMLQGDSSSGSGQRRKSGSHVRKGAGSTSGKEDLVRSYWNSMNLDLKKEFIRIKISDLTFHFGSSKDKLNGFVEEALRFASPNKKTWKFWLCCYCGKLSFPDSESLQQHVKKSHVGNLSPEVQSVLPKNVEDDWIEMIDNYTWKPLDAYAALKMLADKAKSQEAKNSEETNITESIEVEGSVEASAAVKMLEDDQAKAKDNENSEEANNTEGVEVEGSLDASTAVKMLEDDRAKAKDTENSEEANITEGVEVEWSLDASAAVKMLEDDQAKAKDTENCEETNITEGVEVEGSVDASAAVKMLEDDRAKAKDTENSEEANITEGVEVEWSLDASAAVKMLEDDQAKAKDTENSEEANNTEGVEVEGSLDASTAVKMLEDDRAKAKDTENSEEANITEGVEVEWSLDGSAAVKMLEDDQAKAKDTENCEETNITEGVEVEGSVDASVAVKMLEDDQAKAKDTENSEEANITEGVEVEGSLDASAAVKMLEDDQAKAKDTENSEETNITEGVEVEGSVDASAAVKMLEDDQAKAKDTENSEEANITEGVEVEGSLDASAAVKMLEDDHAKAEDIENSEEANITESVEVEGSVDASAAVKMLEDDQAKAKDTENSEEANITEGVEVEGSLDASAAVKMLEDDQAKAKDTENSEEANNTEGVEVEGSLDASTAVKMLEDDRAKAKDTENSEETNITEGVEVEGSVDSSAAVKVLEDQAKPKDTNKSEETNITQAYDWPLSDDSERAELLEKIPEEFKTLNRRKCLAASHLDNVIEFSMNWIEELATRSKHMNQHLDLSPTCICFLEAPQLREILKFLDALSRACDNCKSPIDDLPDISQNAEIKENIALNEDATCLVLDETLVPEEITPVATDPFLSWMFSGLSCRAELDSFKRKKEYRRPQAMEFVQTLDNECNRLQRLSETKCKQKNYNETLQMVEDICIEGKNFSDPDHQTYGSVLKRRKEELIKGENDAAVHVSDKLELIAITNILEEADAILKLNDNESGEDDEEIIMDICIEIAIEKMKETQSLELSKTDAQLLRSMTNVKELELKLGLASGFDFRETLLPIVKLYLRTRLEDLAMKDATNKSDAAAQAFLAELDLEASQQGVAKSQESDKKPKNKGKKKQKGKTENLKNKKATYDHEQPVEDIGSSSGVPVHDDDKVKDHAEKQEEDELGLRVKELEQETTELLQKLQNPELGEEEERKLTEELNQKLELQTQVANEASLMQQGWQQL